MKILGSGMSRLGASAKLVAAAMFLALAPLGASAQTPETPPATTDGPPAADGVDTSIPGLTDTAPAPEPVSAPPPAGEVETVEVENPFTIAHMWEVGDIVARSTLIIMILMSAGSWYIVATKLIDQNRLLAQRKKVGEFWSSDTIDEGLERLGRNNAFRAIAEGAIAEANNPGQGLESRISRTDRSSHRVGIELDRLNSRLSGGMAFLATVGSTAPFIGLFGTVWGILNALIRIGLSGEASIDVVAGPVGEALIMTAIGLGVAVPAVIFYNLLGRRNKDISDVARYFATDVERLVTAPATARS
jgi:biopolymer transport protein ExbB